MWLLKYNRELKKGLGGLYEFVLRLLKGLYLVFFRGDLDKILQRHLEMMKVYLSDRALHGHVMLGHSLTNWEIVERLLFVWKTRKFRKEFICNGSLRWKFFREKSNAFRGITFFPFLPKGSKSPVPFSWITSARLQVERKRKIYRYFVNGTTQSRSCFLCHKKIPVIFDGNFSPKFPYKW